MLGVAAIERRANVLANDVADLAGPLGEFEQILGKRRGRHLGDMLVLSDREDLLAR